ncbi:hypothetical protein PT273_05255 [Orbaceae bacterium ESL0727]|nr:hypothetical protein [Orbaceae bacterium ESL0727]
MISEFIPAELHSQLNAFYGDLEKITLQQIKICPFCGNDQFFVSRSRSTYTYRCKACHKYSTSATHTPFNRLIPFNWLKIIFENRIQNQSYQTIAKNLGCSLEKVMRRDHALIAYLQQHYPTLHNWYKNRQYTAISPTIKQQKQIVHDKIRQLLSAEKINCIHCSSHDTVKIGARAAYRCKSCACNFNLLGNTPLNRLPHTDLWLKFIDLLVAGYNNLQISQALQLNANTVSKWRRAWCQMMETWNCNALAIFCSHP